MSTASNPLPFRFLFAVYTGMTQLDFTGPYQFLSRMPGSETLVASLQGGEVAADGLTFADTRRLADVTGCDLLCVPGGPAATRVALDEAFLVEIRRLAVGARYVTSVCTGSLILAAAGLLKGRRAACHWAWRDLLSLFGAIPDPGRVVRDGRYLTGGGVTAGIDFALAVLAEVAGETLAQTIQLGLEYAPEPPFDAGRPKTAPAEVLAGYRKVTDELLAKRRAEAVAAAARLSD